MVYTIRCDNEHPAFTARGGSPEEAARHAARRLYGRSVVALRWTGDVGKSGVFAAYRSIPQRRGGGMTSTGGPFTVTPQ